MGRAAPAGGAALPATSVPVSGSDWFAVMVDEAMRRRLGRGHTSHLVVELEGRLPLAVLRDQLRGTPLHEAGRARLVVEAPWRPARWALVGPPTPVGHHALPETADLDAEVVPALDAPLHHAPVRLDLVDREGRTDLVLSWSHALADARGAERLALDAAAGRRDTRLLALPDAPPPRTVIETLRRAKAARDALFVGSLPRFTTLGRARRREAPRWARRAVPSSRVRAAAGRAGAGPFLLAFLVAVAAVEVAALARSRGLPRRDVLVPAPLDRRRRGAPVAALGNRLGVVIFRVPAAAVTDVRAATAACLGQLRGRLRSGWPEDYDTLLALCRHLPVDLLGSLVGLPSGGRLATFGLSYLASGLGELRSWGGVPVRRAYHLPSNPVPPGLTVVATEAGDTLELCVGHLPSLVSPAEADGLLARLAAHLEEA
ncbi:MAG: hypothetical protein H6732_11860 [Alphaproteobacteria bacterium]|nr:hypothetical protein [Alphaproteobacteria bacterium]